MAKAEFLKKRAEDFLKTADYHMKECLYSLAAFDLEQVCQLYLKYYLFLKLADFPRTHELKELLEGIGRAYKKENEIRRFQQENFSLIADLNQAYITSRYLPAEFNQKQIEIMQDFVQRLVSLLKNL